MARHTDKGFIDVVRVAIASMLSLQAVNTRRVEFDAPEKDRCRYDSNSLLSAYIFQLPVVQIEVVVAPPGIEDHRWRIGTAFTGASGPILVKLADRGVSIGYLLPQRSA